MRSPPAPGWASLRSAGSTCMKIPNSDRSSRAAQIEAYYRERFSMCGDTPQGVDWNGAESQGLRFTVLERLFRSRSGFSVLDVGCGTGALLAHLEEAGLSGFRYVGIDLCEPMIRAAREKFPERGTFVTGELADSSETFDYVVSSGILNVKQDEDAVGWRTHVQETVRRQYELCRIGAAFNAITSQVDFTRDHLFYWDPADALRFCLSLSRHVAIRHDYPLYEFTACIYRETHRG